MFDCLKKIKDKKYYPDVIFDIGCYHGEWTKKCLQIFPDSTYHLFDGNEHNQVNQLNVHKNVHIHNNVILNDSITEVDWFKRESTGDSFLKEKTYFFNNCEIIKRKTISLTEYIKQTNLLKDPKNILIKIDTQGSELNVLKGSTLILSNTDFIILEVPLFGEYNEGAPKFLDYMLFMDSIGFIPYDIVNTNHFTCAFNVQIDICFINKLHSYNTLVQNTLLRIV